MTLAQLVFDNSRPFLGVEERYGSDDADRSPYVLALFLTNICNDLSKAPIGRERDLDTILTF